jgi:hypothetical protein
MMNMSPLRVATALKFVSRRHDMPTSRTRRIAVGWLAATSFLILVIDEAVAQAPAPVAGAEASPPIGPFKWKASGILISPISDENHQIVSVKDPTVVFHNDKWHVYATVASTQRQWSMVYLSFKDWSEAKDAKPYYMNMGGNRCAPHLFYFRPHQKWYLVYQSQPPQYSTTDDISKPETWTEPVNFYATRPASLPRLPIDYWVICDATHAYLFFTGDDGNLYRSRTKIEDFPNGMSDPEIAIRENRNILFEASMTYKIKGMDKYLTLVEALEPTRFYRAFLADKLDGPWTPVPGSDTFEKPFAGIHNVTFAEGVAPWTREISHGEVVRDSNDETMTLDLNNMRFLFQGKAPDARGEYSQRPYRLGLLTLEK